MNPNYWQTDLIRLRAVEPEDWEIYVDWDLDSESARQRYMIPFPPSKEFQKKKALDRSLSNGENDEYTWMIENRQGVVVGNINSYSTDRRNGTFCYGVGIRREYWGMGFAAEAVRQLLAYFFNELGYQKCTVDVYEFNSASIRLHEKLGFSQEGRVRRMIYSSGEYHDRLIYGMTVEEFCSRSGQGRSTNR